MNLAGKREAEYRTRLSAAFLAMREPAVAFQKVLGDVLAMYEEGADCDYLRADERVGLAEFADQLEQFAANVADLIQLCEGAETAGLLGDVVLAPATATRH